MEYKWEYKRWYKRNTSGSTRLELMTYKGWYKQNTSADTSTELIAYKRRYKQITTGLTSSELVNKLNGPNLHQDVTS